MRCDDNTLFVFTQYNEHHFMVVSDEGESVPFLKRQLQLIHELLQFHFGPKAESKVSLWPSPPPPPPSPLPFLSLNLCFFPPSLSFLVENEPAQDLSRALRHPSAPSEHHD